MEYTDSFMGDHFMSSPDASMTDTSYYETSSEDGGGPWLSFSGFAKSIGRNIDDLAHTINRGARNILNELSELENEALRERSDSASSMGGSEVYEASVNEEVAILPLPWEICLQSTDADKKISIIQTEDEPLKQSILALSLNNDVFTQPFTTSTKGSDSFCLDEARVMLIRRLLQLDCNLGKVHAKVSGMFFYFFSA